MFEIISYQKTGNSNWFTRQCNHVGAFILVKIVSASVEHISVLRIHLYNHITIGALWTFKNIMLMNLIIGHEIAHFGVICANPKL